MQSPQRYHLFDTSIGVCGAAWSERGLTRLQLPEANRQSTERRLRAGAPDAEPGTPPPRIARLIDAVRRYASGEKVDFASAELDLSSAPPFHAKVYDVARGIGWGETSTYGALARVLGEPGAARAVGQAMGRNPVPIIIPCHRVLAAGGKSGGFSAFGGVDSKARLLALEGVRLARPATTETTQQAFEFAPVSRAVPRHR